MKTFPQTGRDKKSMKLTRISALVLVFSFFFLHGCASLLPSSKDSVKSPWTSFDEVRSSYDKIIPGKTTYRELKDLGFATDASPNVKNLNYLDVAKAVQPIRKEELDAGLAACLDARDDCRAYDLELTNLNRKRYGNFWLDLLNFKRKTRETGWRFRALIVVVRDLTTYKVWSGEPRIDQSRESKNPLGPLQDVGGLISWRP